MIGRTGYTAGPLAASLPAANRIICRTPCRSPESTPMEDDMDAVTVTGNTTLAAAYRPLKDHALRESLANEMHARPAEGLRSPLRVTHLAMLSGEGNSEI